MNHQVTLTINDPNALESIGRGDHSSLIWGVESSYFVTSIRTESEWVLVSLYVRRNDLPSTVLIGSWKEWGFSRFRVRPGYIVELEVAWMGDGAPKSSRVAILELEEN